MYNGSEPTFILTQPQPSPKGGKKYHDGVRENSLSENKAVGHWRGFLRKTLRCEHPLHEWFR
jgi:hypothetical protein